MNNEISGVLPILHTPFDDQDRIDRESLAREIDWAYQVGADGVCVAMVSELLRLTHQERIELTEMMAEYSAGRGLTVSSIGAENTQDAIRFGKVAEEAGCDAVMAIPPINTALPQDALWKYFCEIADQVQLPLFVQDASSYVGQPIPVSFYLRLLDKYGPDKILFKPEAEPIGPSLSQLRDQSGHQAKIFDGSGGILLIDCYRRGISGTMPGCDLLEGIVALWRALQAGDDETAYRIYFPICAIVALQLQAGLDGFLAIEKHLMVRRGIFKSDRRREPYSWVLDDETRAEVDRLFERLQAALIQS